MCGSKSAPKAPPPVPEAPRLPDASTVSAGGADKRRQRAAAGESTRSTILTSSRGVQNGAATATKNLLGE